MKLQDYILANRPPPTLDELVGRVREISTIPHVAMKVMQVANDPGSSVADMKSVIEMDAALSARILRCVNSSAYGLREKASSLHRAIAYIGLRQIRSLALTASVAELFANDEAIGPYHRRGLWKHLVAVGICARLIAMRRGVEDFEDAFVAGLLHDIGIILEDQYVHEHFRRVLEKLDDKTTLVEMERKQLGFDHARLGAKIAESWRFSERIKAAIGFHHMSANYRGEELKVVRCVEVANLICTVKGYSSVGRKLVAVPVAALAALSLSRDDLLVLAQDLEEEFSKNAALFDL